MLRRALPSLAPRSARTIFGLARARMAANKRWVFALALGMLTAAVLLSIAPIYHRAMVDLGLRSAVTERLVAPTGPDGLLPYDDPAIQQPEVGLSRTEAARAPVVGEEATTFAQSIETEQQARLGWLATSYGKYTRLSRIMGSRPGEPERPFAETYVQSLEGWEKRVRVVDGTLPGPTPAGADLEVAISHRSSELAGLVPGQRFQLNMPCGSLLEECENRPEPITVVVAAVVEPLVPLDPFWAAGPASYLEPTFLMEAPGLLLPVLLPIEQFNTVLTHLPEGTTGYRSWYSFTYPERLTRGTVNRALVEIEELEDLVAPREGVAFSPMGNTVREFEKEADHQRAPLAILLLEIAAIALFYLILVASAVLDRQSREISLLRSRGTSGGQVLLSFLFEALIIGFAVTLLAPLVAAGMVAVLGVTPIFEGVTDGELLDVTLLPSAFLFAAGGALLGILAIMAPAAIASRRGLVSQRQAESRPGKPFFQRYFLDVAFVAIALLLLWELNERGSVYEPSSTGGVSSDPLLLASPALIVFAGALIFLRFYPIVLRGLAWVAMRGPGVSPGMGISTVVRRPGQYGQLALLLLMAVAVGTFAASYSATTDRSQEDRALFESGVEFRAGDSDATLGTIGSRADAGLAELPYQETATAVMRTEANVSLSGSGGRSLQLLGVDPEIAGDMLWYRDDFADSSLDGVLGPLRTNGNLPGIEVPGVPVSFSVWVYLPEERQATSLWARFQDAAGNTPLVDLGNLEFEGWQELTGQLESPTGEITAPVRLTAIILSSPPIRGALGADNSMTFDDFAVTDSSGTKTIVEDFEAATPTWQPLLTSSVNTDTLESSTDQKHGGARAAKVTFGQASSNTRRGFFPSSDRFPIPIAASEQLLGQLGLGEGGRAVLLVGDVPVPVQVHSTYRLFPTLPSEEGPSAVISRDELSSWLRTWSISGTRVELNEVWATFQPGVTDEQREELARILEERPFGLTQSVDREGLFAEIDADPLLAAGGTGILAVGFGAALILLGAAAAVVLFTDAERRRPEFAVMRALGFSRGQTARMLALEYGLLVVYGIALGAILGRQLGDRMLSFLNVNEQGDRVEPEFILETDWMLLGASALVIVVAFAVTLGVVVAIARRLNAGQVLRTD